MLQYLKYPAAVLFIASVFLAFEAWKLGWMQSSLRRVLRPDASTKEDLFYFVITLTSVSRLLALVMSLGLGYFLGGQIEEHFSLSLLWGSPAWIQFPIVLLVDSLAGYWHHRLMHSRWFWEIHKVHHAATEFNGVTSFRNHPLDGAINTPTRALALSLLGARLDVLAAFSLFNIVYQIAVHSRYDWGRGWFGRWVFINPSRHMIHHATESRFWNKNFSSLTLWDHVFGTYYEVEATDPAIGFKDDTLHNQGTPARSMVAIYEKCVRWLTLARNEN